MCVFCDTTDISAFVVLLLLEGSAATVPARHFIRTGLFSSLVYLCPQLSLLDKSVDFYVRMWNV